MTRLPRRVRQQGECHQDQEHAEDGCPGTVDLTCKLIVNGGRKCPIAQHGHGAKIREHIEPDQQSPPCDRRRDQRQRNLAKALPAAAPQHAGRLFQRPVHRTQRRSCRQIDVRVADQPDDQRGPAKIVQRGQRHLSTVKPGVRHQQRVHDPATAQQEKIADSCHVAWDGQGQRQQHTPDAAPWQIAALDQPGHAHPQQQRKSHSSQQQQQALHHQVGQLPDPQPSPGRRAGERCTQQNVDQRHDSQSTDSPHPQRQPPRRFVAQAILISIRTLGGRSKSSASFFTIL